MGTDRAPHLHDDLAEHVRTVEVKVKYLIRHKCYNAAISDYHSILQPTEEKEHLDTIQ